MYWIRQYDLVNTTDSAIKKPHLNHPDFERTIKPGLNWKAKTSWTLELDLDI